MAGDRRRGGNRPSAVEQAAASTRPPDPRLDAIVFSAKDLDRAQAALAQQAALALRWFDSADYLKPEVRRDRLNALMDGFGLTEDDMTEIRRTGTSDYRDHYGEFPKELPGELLEYALGGYARLRAAKNILADSRIGLDRATAEQVWASEVGAAGRRLTDLIDRRPPITRERVHRQNEHRGWGYAGGTTFAGAVTAFLAAVGPPWLPWVSGPLAVVCLLGCVAAVGDRLGLRKQEKTARADTRAASDELHRVLGAVPGRPAPGSRGVAR